MNKVLLLLLVIFCVSCTQKKQSGGVETLTVDLTENNLSVHDLFSKIELIPLATNDSFFIKDIEKVTIVGDSIYIFDWGRSTLFVFGSDGHFIKQIGKRENGPEDHIMVYDAFVENNITLLSPMGYIYNYDLKGRFINKQKLPAKMNYQSFPSIKISGYYGRA